MKARRSIRPGGRVRVPQQDGYFRACAAGGDGLRAPGCGLSRHGAARCARGFQGGVMHEDPPTACMAALELKREDVVTHARKFSWRAATEEFLAKMHPRTRGAKPHALLADRGQVSQRARP